MKIFVLTKLRKDTGKCNASFAHLRKNLQWESMRADNTSCLFVYTSSVGDMLIQWFQHFAVNAQDTNKEY